MERTLRWVQFQFLGTPQKCGFGCACVLCLPWPKRPWQPEAWAPSPRVWRAFSLRGPSARCWSDLRKSLDRNRGACLQCGRGWLLWGWVCPFPLPPASYLWDGPALLWSFSVPLFCEPSAVCSGRLIFPCYPTVLKKCPLTALRAFRPVLTLSNAVRSSPFHRTCWWRFRASGVVFFWELLLGT